MAVEDILAVLRAVPLVGLFEAEALRVLAFSADTRRLRAGEVLFRQGDRSDGGYVVVAGRLAARSDDGHPEPVILERGALIGRTSLFVRSPRPASVTAETPSEVLRLSPTLMTRVLTEFPASLDAVRTALAADLADLAEALGTVGRRLDAIDASPGAGGEPARPGRNGPRDPAAP